MQRAAVGRVGFALQATGRFGRSSRQVIAPGLSSAACASSLALAVPKCSFFSVMYWLSVRSWPVAASSRSIASRRASRTCRNNRPKRGTAGVQVGVGEGMARHDARPAKLSRQIYDSERIRYLPRITISYDLCSTVPARTGCRKGQQQQAHRHQGPAHGDAAAPATPPAPSSNPPNTSHDSRLSTVLLPDAGRTGFRRTARRSATSASAARIKPTAMVRNSSVSSSVSGGNARSQAWRWWRRNARSCHSTMRSRAATARVA